MNLFISISIYKKFGKSYIKFKQIKMKLYATITDLEFSMSFINLFKGLLVQRYLVFSSKAVLLYITCHHFGHLTLPYRSFLLITSPNLSNFCRRVPYIHSRLLSSPYLCIQKCSGFHYLSLHNTRGRFFLVLLRELIRSFVIACQSLGLFRVGYVSKSGRYFKAA